MYMHEVNAIEIVLKNINHEKFDHFEIFFTYIESEKKMSFFELKRFLLVEFGLITKHFFRAKKNNSELGFKHLEKAHQEYECLLQEIENLEAETKEQIARVVL